MVLVEFHVWATRRREYPHLIDDETVAKMGHPNCEASDPGDPPGGEKLDVSDT
jgi:hypothetical protein